MKTLSQTSFPFRKAKSLHFYIIEASLLIVLRFAFHPAPPRFVVPVRGGNESSISPCSPPNDVILPPRGHSPFYCSSNLGKSEFPSSLENLFQMDFRTASRVRQTSRKMDDLVYKHSKQLQFPVGTTWMEIVFCVVLKRRQLEVQAFPPLPLLDNPFFRLCRISQAAITLS